MSTILAEPSDEDEILDLSSVFTEPKEMENGENLSGRWNCHYEELTRYKQLCGTTAVKNTKHPDGELIY